MRHDAHLVKRRLPVEEHDVTLLEVPVHEPSVFEHICNLLAGRIADSQSVPICPDHVVRARVIDRTAAHVLPEFLDVSRHNLKRDRQFSCNRLRNADLVDRQVRIRRDNSPRAEIDTLARETAPEPPFLPFQALGQGLQRSSAPVPCRRYP